MGRRGALARRRDTRGAYQSSRSTPLEKAKTRPEEHLGVFRSSLVTWTTLTLITQAREVDQMQSRMFRSKF